MKILISIQNKRLQVYYLLVKTNDFPAVESIEIRGGIVLYLTLMIVRCTPFVVLEGEVKGVSPLNLTV